MFVRQVAFLLVLCLGVDCEPHCKRSAQRQRRPLPLQQAPTPKTTATNAVTLLATAPATIATIKAPLFTSKSKPRAAQEVITKIASGDDSWRNSLW
jgi:hypothetical protein